MKNHFRLLKFAAVAGGLAVAQAAVAQTAVAPQGTAMGVPFGPMMAYPGIGLVLGHDDNLFLSNANKRSSFFSIVSPFVKLEARRPSSVYDLTYKGDFGNYWNSSADNYEDHQVLGNANWTFTARSGLKLRAEYLRGHDPRGSTDRPSGTEPDRWHSSGISGVFGYGGVGPARIEVESGYVEKRYDNNRVFTAAADRDTTSIGATFFYRVMPRTSLLFQVTHAELDYPGSPPLDSSEQRYLAGVKWEATAKTTGTFKIGQFKKDFDSPLRQDFSGVGWEGAVRWSPLTYSVFDFTTAREPNESTGLGDFILTKRIAATWTHAWNSRTTSYVNLGFRNDDFRGAGVSRSDDTATGGVRLTYQMRRWLNLGAEYSHTTRSSDIPVFDYDRNLFMLTLGATL